MPEQPAFAADGTVVGVAFQSLGGDADGIGYLIPAVVCQNFLAATTNGQPYGGARLGAHAQRSARLFDGLPR